MRIAFVALLFAAGCGSSTGPSTFSAINAQTLQPSCAFASSCHSVQGASGADHLDLKTDPYNALVNQPAGNPQAMMEGKLRVKPGDSANSFLYIKLTIPPGPGNVCPTATPADVTGYGGCMPQTAHPLDADTIAGIKAWIDSGAPNN